LGVSVDMHGALNRLLVRFEGKSHHF
jgi:hypothetical protein